MEPAGGFLAQHRPRSDPILIFGFGLGVARAAVATIVSQIAALLAYVVYFRNGWDVVRVRWRLLRPDPRLLRPVLAVGVPATFRGLIAALSLAAIYGAASPNGSDEVLAGVGIALRLVALGTLPIIGFCLGAQPVLSFACGAGNFARMLGALRPRRCRPSRTKRRYPHRRARRSQLRWPSHLHHRRGR